MATINQELENPPNTLEKQVQTLATTVEQLTQRNHELERKLGQQNEKHPNDQNDEHGGGERNNNRPRTNNHQERDNQDESI